jgi:chorismate mutase/prephenate dehydratase
MNLEEARAALAGFRDEIDALDREILERISARAAVAGKIGDIKRQAGLPVVELAREQQVIDKVVGANQGPLPDDSVRRVYQTLMVEMRLIQYVRMTDGGAPESK